MSPETKKNLDRRLARLEGQVRGVRRMLNEDAYCVDVLTQLAAIRSALDSVGAELATAHVESCIVGYGTGSEHAHCRTMTQEDLVEELRITLGRLIR
ncbi:MAG: metal-sensitive transcriptional regulator [Fimbriimonadaceae bacterium]|nr:metal-sensitive transcriptional regulator [Fimbriimonadaceae bacterium]